MINTTQVNERIWQIEEIRRIEWSEVKRENFTNVLSHIESFESKVFRDALYTIRGQFVESLRKLLAEELKKELSAIDAKISEDQETLYRLSEAAENAIGGV